MMMVIYVSHYFGKNKKLIHVKWPATLILCVLTIYYTISEDPQKILVGKIIILKDEDTGGIKVRGYTNTSFGKES